MSLFHQNILFFEMSKVHVFYNTSLVTVFGIGLEFFSSLESGLPGELVLELVAKPVPQ